MSATGGKIARVVVLMLENRSFDHMFGFLDHPGLDPLDETVALRMDPSDPSSAEHAAHPLRDYEDVSVDPGHGYPDVMRQLTGREDRWDSPGAIDNDGFVWNYATRLRDQTPDGPQGREGEIMGCYPESLVPILSTLAKEFAVCPRWFCSVPSETWPNRMFAHTGHSSDLVKNVKQLYDDTTIFEMVQARGVSWKVYYGDYPQVAVYRGLHSLFHDDFDKLGTFFKEARAGTLPDYSFIEPKHFGRDAASEHPRQRVWRGERLIREVYQALADNPDVWESVLLIVTYDEHGGFFDRVSPPKAIPPRPGHVDPDHGFAFDVLGPRVPAVVISPYIQRGTVDREEHDHATIPRTLREIFGVTDAISEREANAKSVLHLLGDEKRPPAELPAAPEEVVDVAAGDTGWADPSRWAEGVDREGRIVLNDFQRQLLELAQLVDQELAPELAPAPEEPIPEFSYEEELERHLDGVQSRQFGEPAADDG